MFLRDAFAPIVVAVGLSWAPPSGWQPVRSQLTALSQPAHRLAAATFELRQPEPDRDCRPDTARTQLPPDGALVYLLEDREAEARPHGLAHYPPRPVRFRLSRAHTYECLGRGSIVWWTEQGRAFQARVLLGPRAPAARRHEAEALLDSLVVGRTAPPEPPVGWRSIVSGAYDSIRVPPGWRARALKRVPTTPRPRTLFRLANRAETVVVRVTELRRDHGRRFSTRIFTRPGAGPRDVGWANVAARSFGFARD